MKKRSLFSTIIRYTFLGFMIFNFVSCASRMTQSIHPKERSSFECDYTLRVDSHCDSLFFVEMRFSNALSNRDTLQFPVQVPGAYETFNIGDYIRNVEVVDVNNIVRSIEKSDRNFWLIGGSAPIKVIRYSVRENSRYQAAGSDSALPSNSVLQSDYALMNTYATLGYIRGMQAKPIRLRLVLPDDWDIGTSLKKDSSGFFYAENYDQLADSPIMAGRLSKDAFAISGHRFYTYLISSNRDMAARSFRRILKQSVRNTFDFSKPFSDSEYVFLFHFVKQNNRNSVALEHRRSSCYTFNDDSMTTLKRFLRRAVPHELLHVKIPLTTRGNQIAQFDYARENPIDNLWFYEGVIDWASYKMRLIKGKISLIEFMRSFRSNLQYAKYKDLNTSLVDLSREILDPAHYGDMRQFYTRGMVVATLIDIEIINLTDGKMGLSDVLSKLIQEYPFNHPFNDQELVDIICSYAGQELQPFIKCCIESSSLPSLYETFDKIGIRYSDKREHPVISSDLGVVPWQEEFDKHLFAISVDPSAARFGYRKGDTLLSIDGQELTAENIQQCLANLVYSPPGKAYEMLVKRNRDQVRLHARTVPAFIYDTFGLMSSLNQKQARLRSAWLSR